MYQKIYQAVLRYKTLNSWSDKRALDVLVTLLPEHLADVVEASPEATNKDIVINDIFKLLTEELDDATDVITKMENVTLMDGQVDTYVLSVRQAGGDQATDELVASSLLRQLSAEMRQSAILHTDSSLQSIVKHVKAYFKSRKMAPAIFGAISQPNPQSTHTVNNSDLMNQILTTQREQQQLLQVQTELLKTLTLGKNPRCYGCGELGHIRRNCPNTRYQGYRSGNNKVSWGGPTQGTMEHVSTQMQQHFPVPLHQGGRVGTPQPHNYRSNQTNRNMRACVVYVDDVKRWRWEQRRE
ncbi:hypothetical protein GQR58_022290 [Nymphon striatum]|nr:hypothetical protein GQR58_022290 [Nymphon striatum]